MNNFSRKDIPYLILSFFIPLSCFIITSSHSLMFDDAAEFALVAKLGSIAHPPGTPSFILFGFIWIKLASLFGINIIDSLNLFSSICISVSSMLLYISFKFIAFNLSVEHTYKSYLSGCLVAIGFSTATTTWAWGNTIEVYAFQVFAMSLTLLGLINYHFDRKNISIIITATGLALGLGNHHLTMVLFLPFVPIFFLKNIFILNLNTDSKKKTKNYKPGFFKQILNVLKMSAFRKLAGITLLFTSVFYIWMFIRAQNEYPFMFGKPDTFGELIYHISGSAYFDDTAPVSNQIFSSRIPYFISLTVFQLFLFLPFFIAGIVLIFKKKLYPLFWTIVLYFIILFYYQLNNNQWSSDTNAYMLLPFMLFYLAVFYGVFYYFNKIKGQFIIPLIIIFQLIYNFSGNNKKSYPVSESLMNLLDKSAPKNSIVIISDWTLIIQYYFYRLTENFRPDLIVLNNDIKFDHYRMLPIIYPEFYKQIKSEYDGFIDEMKIVNPHQAFGTGCDLTTSGLVNKFTALINKIKSLASANKVFFLTDPRAHYFFSSSNLDSTSRYVSGCFSSTIPGDSIANNYFLNMDFKFLKSPLLLKDPSALNKLIDFQSMLDRYMEFYQANNDPVQIEKTREAQNKIVKLQLEMKKNISFAFETN